ncbi:MAG TPA: hypothetical protein VNK95_03520, partial [Caldilineaceae bacterium]|nr:hypothetical protein [Caldilineaceae bacterium]
LAAHLTGAAAAQREQAGLPLTVNSQQIYERILAPARRGLGETGWARAVAAGRNLPWQEAIRMARGLQVS